MWHSMWAWDGGWAWFGMAHLLWWALLVAAAVVLVRAVGGGLRAGRPRADRASDILRERFARGEIDHGEYEQKLRRLREDPAPRD